MTKTINCYRWSEEHRVKGYLDTFTYTFQEFKEEYYLCGIKIKSKSLFKEVIPEWVMIGLMTLGFYDDTNWKSEAPQWMHDAVNKK